MTHHRQVSDQAAGFQGESWRDREAAWPDEARRPYDGETPGGFLELLTLLSEQGFDGMARAMQLLVNEAMKLERSAVLGARPYERTPARRGQANGFKPKTVQTRVGALELRVPFYPSALERGQRSERALKLAIAEMYVQGVTTRKVAAVMEELCGLEVTSSQVSRAVQALDAELTAWRERPLGGEDYYELDRGGALVADLAEDTGGQVVEVVELPFKAQLLAHDASRGRIYARIP